MTEDASQAKKDLSVFELATENRTTVFCRKYKTGFYRIWFNIPARPGWPRRKSKLSDKIRTPLDFVCAYFKLRYCREYRLKRRWFHSEDHYVYEVPVQSTLTAVGKQISPQFAFIVQKFLSIIVDQQSGPFRRVRYLALGHRLTKVNYNYDKELIFLLLAQEFLPMQKLKICLKIPTSKKLF